MTFERYGIIVVPFPFTDRVSTIRRPALILSKAILQCEAGQLAIPLQYFSEERLSYVAARRDWIEPDIAALPVSNLACK